MILNKIPTLQSTKPGNIPSQFGVNPNALVGVIFGTSTLLYAAGKKPPQLLLLAGLLISTVTLTQDMARLFEVEENM